MSPVNAPERTRTPRTRAEAYQCLGLAPGARYEEVRAAYRHRAWATHPDQGGDPADWLAVAAAWEMLRGITPAQARASAEDPPGGQTGGGFDPSWAAGGGSEPTPAPEQPRPQEPEEPEEETPPVSPPRARRGQWRPGRLVNLRPAPGLLTFAAVLVVGTAVVATVSGATATTETTLYAAMWAIMLMWRSYGRPWGR